MIFVLSLVALAAAEGCEDTADLALEARTLMLEGRLEEADDRMDRAQDSLACGDLPVPEVLAELWLSQGARRFLDNDPLATDVAFVAAHRSDPTLWDPTLGDELRKLYGNAVATASGEGEVYMADLPRGYRSALSGVRTDFPATVSSGQHLINVYDRRQVHFGEIIYVPPGETIEVNFGELPPSKKPIFLIGGGVSAVAAGGLAVGALMQSDIMSAATTLDDLNSAQSRQKAFAYASYSLAGLAATALTLQIVL